MEVPAAPQERGVFQHADMKNKFEDPTGVKNSDSFQDYELACSSLKSYMKLHRFWFLQAKHFCQVKKNTLILRGQMFETTEKIWDS